MLIGGGDRPPEAMQLLSEWAGGANAKVLIIGWASQQPEVYFKSFSKDLGAQGVTTFLDGTIAPRTEAEKDTFVEKVHDATAIIFSGGNQNLAMRVVNRWNLKSVFRTKFFNGIPFAGTSAGTAMMAEQMMTGESEKMIGEGLGLFKKAIFDMHFITGVTIKPREPRLLKAMDNFRVGYGIGVDEGGSLAIVNSSDAKVFGEKHVVFFRRKADRSVVRVELGSQETFNVAKWKAEFSCPWSMALAL